MTHGGLAKTMELGRLLISVEPNGKAWRVRFDGAQEDLTFESGWKAELAARALGRAFAASGRCCKIRIHMRDGDVAGDIYCGPEEPLLH